MKYDVTLTIGHNVNGKPRHSTPKVCAVFENVTGIEAYTAIPCFGMWRGEAEESTRIECNGLTSAQAVALIASVSTLAARLEQAEIMTGYYQSRTEFISARTDAARTA